jgi:hypothetical protein
MALDRKARDPVMTVDNLVQVGMSYRCNEDGRSCSRLTRARSRNSGDIGEGSIDKVTGDLDDSGSASGREVLPGHVDAARSHPAIRRVENFLIAELTGVARPAQKIGVRPVDNSARWPEEITGGRGILGGTQSILSPQQRFIDGDLTASRTPENDSRQLVTDMWRNRQLVQHLRKPPGRPPRLALHAVNTSAQSGAKPPEALGRANPVGHDKEILRHAVTSDLRQDGGWLIIWARASS